MKKRKIMIGMLILTFVLSVFYVIPKTSLGVNKSSSEDLCLTGERFFNEYLASRNIKLKKGSFEYSKELIKYVSDPSFRPAANKRNLSIDLYAQKYAENLSKDDEIKIMSVLLKEHGPYVNKQNDELKSSGSYYRPYAVFYAHRYALTPNPDYIDFNVSGGGDCTNFVSQCLYSGGVPMVNTIWPRTSSYDWYYFFNNPGYDDDEYSWPWTNAYSLYKHFSWGSSGVAEQVEYDNELSLGDIVQIGSSEYPNHAFHSMIVTKIDNYGNIYVSFHSPGNNTEDEPLTQIEAKYGNCPFYRWHIVY